jgi:hypothetical protein
VVPFDDGHFARCLLFEAVVVGFRISQNSVCSYNGSMVTLICKRCGKPFNVINARKDEARYCSRACRSTLLPVPCCFCGKEVLRSQHWRNHFKVAYCGPGCESGYRRKRYAGENHPRFIASQALPDFSAEQKEVILGTVMGDGCLLLNSNGNAHLQVAHSVKQRPYLDYKHGLLRPFSRPITAYQRLDPRYGKVYETHRFHTVCHPHLTALRQTAYPGGNKVLSEFFDRNLIPRALAFWFMDDGGTSHGSTLSICTVCFEAADLRRIAEHLKDWGLKVWERKRRLWISTESKRRFVELIGDHVIPSMRYKFGKI